MPVATHTFHPAVERWFGETFQAPTPAQARGWPSIQARQHTLIAAPTGAGKTLAAFLCAIDDLVRRGLDGGLEDRVHTVYVSPLRALSHDVRKNLQDPLEGIQAVLEDEGLPTVPVRVEVRTGDTPRSERARMARTPPHLFVTTPESLFILLTSESGRRMLRTAETVIVDEIHAVVDDRRGSHLALSLERLDDLAGRPLTRVGLSATQNPIDDVARFLVGAGAVARDGSPDCTVVNAGTGRDMDLAIEVPGSPLETVMSEETWKEVYDRIAELVRGHRTTLVFVNTRRLAERAARHLADRLGADRVTAHHGSLSREHRLDAEARLKDGKLSALVATASLELGIDIGDVDLVCQIGSTRTVATLVQRVGRSGHRPDRTPCGRLFPTSRDELLECVAAVRCIRQGVLDRVTIPEAPLDVLAQQIVAETAAGERGHDELFATIRRAWPYRALPRETFDEVVTMLADGFSTRRGRRGALVHHDAIGGRIRGRRGAALAAMTSGGAIPDNANYDVVLEPQGTRVGTVEEDFALENLPGNVFQLGNTSYRIRKIEPGTMRVEAAPGVPPSMPFWFGEAPSRSAEMSAEVSAVRSEVARRLHEGDDVAAVAAGFEEASGLSPVAANQLAGYLATAHAALGVLPSLDTVVLERFFDETGGMHVVLHAPFGSRINRAWGLALRKRFCRKFNFELQAAATEDAVVLSLGPTHSFPLDEVFSYLRADTVEAVLVQALLDAPMFGTRWRWNVSRALAVLRFRGGRKVPPPFQRMDAEDLLTVVFPDQVACLENVAGDREVPDHPLVRQTIDDCLREAMDIDGLVTVLRRIEEGTIRTVARDLTEPSPLAAAILAARPYAFLDDAPLEERRTQAVAGRRWLDPQTAADLGALDPDAIARVCSEAWPDPRDADELHDALTVHGAFSAGEAQASGWQALFDALRDARRATEVAPETGGGVLWVAAERMPAVRAVYPGAVVRPEPANVRAEPPPGRAAAIAELVRGRLEAVGPTTVAEIARALALAIPDVRAALAALESEGFLLRGRFRPGVDSEEWCERRLLARIHRYTVHRLRREIEPVPPAAYVRFLTTWQHVEPGSRVDGPGGLAALIERLDGFVAPAAAWEADILPARVSHYDPAWLDGLCLSGEVTWGRRDPRVPAGERRAGPLRSTPLALMRRVHAGAWIALRPGDPEPGHLSRPAAALLAALSDGGAAFQDDLLRVTGLLPARVEEALAELVYRGLATSDGFAGLRGLIAPPSRKRMVRAARKRGALPRGMDTAGRWSLVPTRDPAPDDVETVARALLARWGVVFRRVVDREGRLPPWIELLRVLRRLEARGEVRGGRFVAGFSGEQFAVPGAVAPLRHRREPGGDPDPVLVSAADPLNLAGIVLPGARIPAVATNRILLRDGEIVAARVGGEIRVDVEVDSERRWAWENTLVRRRGATSSPSSSDRPRRGSSR